MKYERQKGCGNDGLWKTRKTKSRFPIVSHSPWKSQTTRFPHSHSPGEARKSGKPKPRFPTFPLVVYFSRKGDQAVASLRFRLIVRLENALESYPCYPCRRH